MLIVHHMAVVDNWPVDQTQTGVDAASGKIIAGSLVGFSSGKAALGSATVNALGIAGDSKATTGQTTAYGAEVIISGGGKRWTQNSVANYFNETAASGKITVYTVGGVFSTTEYVESETPMVQGTPLTCGTGATAGKFIEANPATDRVIGYVTAAPQGDFAGRATPSGIVGTDVAGSTSLGAYLTVLLAI